MAATLILDANRNQIKTSLGFIDKSYRNTIKTYMIDKSKELERYMKVNHPWRNRTGLAERLLSATLASSPSNYVQTIQLVNAVSYGVYLEYAMGKRFAIVEPTIRLKGPTIVNDLQGKIDMFVHTKGVRYI